MPERRIARSVAVYAGDIALPHFASLKGLGDLSPGLFALRDEDEAACFAIEAMMEGGILPKIPANAAREIVNESFFLGMRREALGLIDEKDALVLEDDPRRIERAK